MHSTSFGEVFLYLISANVFATSSLQPRHKILTMMKKGLGSWNRQQEAVFLQDSMCEGPSHLTVSVFVSLLLVFSPQVMFQVLVYILQV